MRQTYFAAYLGGKIVHYPSNAEFVIEQRERGKKKFTLVGTKSTLAQAISRFNSAKRKGKVTRLRAAIDGRFTNLLQEQG